MPRNFLRFGIPVAHGGSVSGLVLVFACLALTLAAALFVALAILV